MIALSVSLGVAAVLLGRALAARLGTYNAVVVASAAFIAAVAVAVVVLPAVNEMPAGFPATVVWQFRLSTAGMQALLWAVFAVVFGYLAQQCVLRPDRSPAGMTAAWR